MSEKREGASYSNVYVTFHTIRLHIIKYEIMFSLTLWTKERKDTTA